MRARALLLPAVLLASAALVLLAPAASASSISLSDYYKKLVRWQISTVPYYLNPAGSADISDQSDIQAVKEGFNDWITLPCSSLKVNFLGNAGNTSLLTGAQANGKNELHWVETSAWTFGKYTLGVTAPLSDYDGKIWEADIAFNGYLQSWSTTGGSGKSDVKGIAIHEIGHFFGIQHNLGGFSQASPPTMAPYWDGTLKARTLEQDDKNAFCFLYDNAAYSCSGDGDCPYVVGHKSNGDEYYESKYVCKSGKCQLGSSTATGTKGIGDSCSTDQECKSPFFCQPVWGQGSMCSQLCNPNSSTSCPSGFLCVPYEGQSTGACIPGGDTTKSDGATCESSSECKSGYCATNPVDDSLECRQTCTVDGGAGQCAKGQVCVPAHGSASSAGACWGTDDVGATSRADTEGCDFDWQCKSGRCVLSEDGAGQFCRASCTPAHPSCAAGTWCVELSAEIGACIPGSPPPPPEKLSDGAICATDEECKSGVCTKPAGETRTVCTTPCALEDDGCPAGQVCVGSGDPVWGVCLPAALPTGAPCSASGDCSSGLCLTDEGATFCTQACVAGSACPCGTKCQFVSGGDVCLPDADAPTCAAAGVPCQTNLECASGACDGGSCAGEAGGSGGGGDVAGPAGDAGGGGSGTGSGSGSDSDDAGGLATPGGLSGEADLTGSASGSGCAASGGPGGGAVALLMLAALVAWRRRFGRATLSA